MILSITNTNNISKKNIAPKHVGSITSSNYQTTLNTKILKNNNINFEGRQNHKKIFNLTKILKNFLKNNSKQQRITKKNIRNVLTTFKKNNPEFKDIKPTITKLEHNNKFKIEYKSNALNNRTETNQIIVCDSQGNFEELISITKNLNSNDKSINVYNNITNINTTDNSNFIKSIKVIGDPKSQDRKNIKVNNFNIRNDDNVFITSSDNLMAISTTMDHSKMCRLTMLELKDGKPFLASNYGSHQMFYVGKSKDKLPLDNTQFHDPFKEKLYVKENIKN